jgi:hypothetical protein
MDKAIAIMMKKQTAITSRHHDEETDVISVCFSGENASVQDSCVDESPIVRYRLVESHTIYRCNLQS